MDGPCVVDVCTVSYIHVYKSMSVCSHYMCKCVCKDREKSLSFLCLLGSGLPSCAHRCVCAFLRSYVWMHTVPPGTRDPPTPFSICSAVSQGGWPWAALVHSLPSLWMEGPRNGPFKGLGVRSLGVLIVFSLNQCFLDLYPGPQDPKWDMWGVS